MIYLRVPGRYGHAIDSYSNLTHEAFDQSARSTKNIRTIVISIDLSTHPIELERAFIFGGLRAFALSSGLRQAVEEACQSQF